MEREIDNEELVAEVGALDLSTDTDPTTALDLIPPALLDTSLGDEPAIEQPSEGTQMYCD